MNAAEHFEERSVRILRHRFEASKKLDEQLYKLVDAEKLGNRRLHIFSTRRVALDLIDYNNSRFDIQLSEIEKRFREEKASIFFDKQLKYKTLNGGAITRLAFSPAHQEKFNFLVNGLKVTTSDGERDVEGKLIKVNHDILNQKLQDHYLFVDVATQALLHRPGPVPVELYDEYADKKEPDITLDHFPIDSNLIYVTPLEITGYDYRYRVQVNDNDRHALDGDGTQYRQAS